MTHPLDPFWVCLWALIFSGCTVTALIGAMSFARSRLLGCGIAGMIISGTVLCGFLERVFA